MKMKILLLSFALLVASVTSRAILASENDDVVGFLQCLKKVLNGGLKEANIPDLSRIQFRANLSIPINVTGANGVLALSDIFINDIPTYDIVSTNVSHPQPNLKNVSYNLNYKRFRVDANYTANLTILGKPEALSGFINVTLLNLNLNGTIQFVSQNGTTTNVTSATLREHTNLPIVRISGVNLVIGQILGDGIALLVDASVNNANTTAAGEGLRQKILTDWLAPNKTQRIDAMGKYCRKFLN